MRKAWNIPMSRTGQKYRRPVYGLDRVARFLPGITRKAFEKFGFAYSEIAQHWFDIVGKDIARHTSPERIRWAKRNSTRQGFPESGSLTIRVDGPRAIEIQHRGPEIIERINRFYGYQAVGAIKIVQGPLPKRHNLRPEKLPVKTNNTAGNMAKAEQALEEIDNQDLKEALQKLGQGVHSPQTLKK
jgi:hypothetical protein